MRYTTEGEVAITIGSGSVTVKDTGPGIPEEDLDRVFERHYRGQNITGKGAGLGLAIVRTCIESCEGTVRCRNLRPKGFEVTLRLRAAGS